MGHLTGEMFKSLTKTPSITHVPHRGGNQLITDTVGGQISMLIAPATDQVLELHKSGKLKILAVTSPGRLIVAPEIPTAVESGVPGLVVFVFIGLFAPTRHAKGDCRADQPGVAGRDGGSGFPAKAHRCWLPAGRGVHAGESPRQYIQYDLERWGPLVRRHQA